MFSAFYKFYTLGLCVAMLYMHRTGWRLTGDSSPVPPGVRSISRSYHSSSSSGSSGGFFHK
jgi:cytochrome b561